MQGRGIADKDNFSVATFNVRGLSSKFKRAQLAVDLEKYRASICCLQETKIKDGCDETHGQYRIYCLPTSCRHYGLGFAIHSDLCHRIHRIWAVTDRVAVIQIYLSKSNLLSLVNVYAPTSTRAAQDDSILEEFYSNLKDTLSSVRTTSFPIVAGDFNAKLGQSNLNLSVNSCVGSYSRGRRNYSGATLADFCCSARLFATNTAFKHPARHLTTWTGWRHNENGPPLPIYNQIDFIFCLNRQKQLFTDARSYAGTALESDHRLVIARARLSRCYGLWSRVAKPVHSDTTRQKLCVSKFADQQTKLDYQQKLSSYVQEQAPATNCEPNEAWAKLSTSILDTARDTIGADNAKHKQREARFKDDELWNLSEQKRRLRLQLPHCDDESKARSLKQQRNQLSHQIRRRVSELASGLLDARVREVEEKKDSAQMFHAVHLLQRKKQEPLSVHDNDGHLVLQQDDVANYISNHFAKLFSSTVTVDTTSDDSAPTQGQLPLNSPISVAEVTKAAARLNNGRAYGPDNMPAECLKYAPSSVHQQMAIIYNSAIETNTQLDGIGCGSLIPLQKPGKAKGPVSHLRPIVLLTTLRKVLSLVALRRINGYVTDFVSPTQSGFRPGRSTSDVVWSYRWITSRCQRIKSSVDILGIDMSKAFDTISRQRLMSVLASFLPEDEVRIIAYLLKKTTLAVTLPSALGEEFRTTRGTPQGDSLSPVLFVIYLEAALRDVRQLLNPRTPEDILLHLPTDIGYADDVDFMSTDGQAIRDQLPAISDTLKEWDLVVNEAKTEFTTISRCKDRIDEEWRVVKKLGSLLGDQEDMSRRQQRATDALQRLWALWIRRTLVHEKLRIRLYKAFILPVLLYNCESLALTAQQLQRFESFHRRQLRFILGIAHPNRISNKNLYTRTESVQLGQHILHARWRMFGHTLRLPAESPPQLAMQAYFINSAKSSWRGRPRITLATIIKQELAMVGKSLSSL